MYSSTPLSSLFSAIKFNNLANEKFASLRDVGGRRVAFPPPVFVFAAAALYVIPLAKRRVSADLMALTAAELGLLFCILATITGSIFAKVTWGSFWNWDPRETSIIVLLMIYGAYFALRSAVPDPDRKRVFAAAYAILAFATVPFLIFIIPRITISLHPENTMNPVNPQMDFRFLVVFLSSLVAHTGLFIWLFSLKLRLLKIQENLLTGIEKWTVN